MQMYINSNDTSWQMKKQKINKKRRDLSMKGEAAGDNPLRTTD